MSVVAQRPPASPQPRASPRSIAALCLLFALVVLFLLHGTRNLRFAAITAGLFLTLAGEVRAIPARLGD